MPSQLAYLIKVFLLSLRSLTRKITNKGQLHQSNVMVNHPMRDHKSYLSVVLIRVNKNKGERKTC